MAVTPLGINGTRSTGVLAYSVLACATTWSLAIPAATAWMAHQAPSHLAVACAGLSAFGPLIAALAIGTYRRELGQVFGRWRASPAWIAAALLAPLLVHTLSRVLLLAVGGHPAHWLDVPRTGEALAAMLVFPLGEEFGWRGFAHPRLVERLGPVRGPLALGAIWGLWHLAYAVTPAAAAFDVVLFAITMVELPLYSLIIALFFERTNRSLAVALAFHAGAHLDNIEGAQRGDLRLLLCHLVVAAVLAWGAAKILLHSRSRGRLQ